MRLSGLSSLHPSTIETEPGPMNGTCASVQAGESWPVSDTLGSSVCEFPPAVTCVGGAARRTDTAAPPEIGSGLRVELVQFAQVAERAPYLSLTALPLLSTPLAVTFRTLPNGESVRAARRGGKVLPMVKRRGR